MKERILYHVCVSKYIMRRKSYIISHKRYIIYFSCTPSARERTGIHLITFATGKIIIVLQGTISLFTILYFYPFRKPWYIISPSGRYINTPKGCVNLYNDDKQDILICLSHNDIIISVIAGSDILKNNVKLTLVLSYIPDFLLVLSAIFVCVDPIVGSIIGIVLSLYLLIGYQFRFQHIYCFWQGTFRSKKRTPNRIEWFRISKFFYVIFPLMLLILYGVIFGFAILGD